MDPVTINFSGLNELTGEFGPYGYLIAYMLITAFLGISSGRHARRAGNTEGDIQSSHISHSIVYGLVGAIMFLPRWA